MKTNEVQCILKRKQDKIDELELENSALRKMIDEYQWILGVGQHPNWLTENLPQTTGPRCPSNEHGV